MSDLEIAAVVGAGIALGSDDGHAVDPNTGEKLYGKRIHRAKMRDGIRRIQGNSTSTSTVNPTLIPIGRPLEGRAWDVRRIQLMNGATPYGAAISTAVAVYVSAQAPQPGATPLPVTDIVDFGSGYPVSFSFGDGELVVQPSENVYVGVLALSIGVLFLATLRAVEGDARNVDGLIL